MSGMIECAVRNCWRQPVFQDESGDLLCERHMPDPSVRSWAEMKAEGIEIETMQEYRDEVRGLHDYDEPCEPNEYDMHEDMMHEAFANEMEGR